MLLSGVLNEADLWKMPVWKYNDDSTFVTVFELREDAEKVMQGLPGNMGLKIESIDYEQFKSYQEATNKVAPRPILLFLKDATGKVWADK